MFLGPVEQSKPWDTNGIDGCHRFLVKLWNYAEKAVDDKEPSKEELKSLHKLIKKVTEDIEHFSYNTSIAAFMICINELTALKSTNRRIMNDLAVLIAPFAPHIAEEFWEMLGYTTTVCDAKWPAFNEDFLKEDSIKMMVSFNGKTRFQMEFPADADKDTIEKAVLADAQTEKYLDGKPVMKVIVVPGRMINIVHQK